MIVLPFVVVAAQPQHRGAELLLETPLPARAQSDDPPGVKLPEVVVQLLAVAQGHRHVQAGTAYSPRRALGAGAPV